MALFKVVYTYTAVGEEEIEAESFDDAKEKWEAEGQDAELFYIEDAEENVMIYC